MLDLGDLNFHIVVPVVSKAGRGTPFSFSLSYDSDFLYPNGGTWGWPQFWGWGNVGPSSGTMSDNPRNWLCTYYDPNLGLFRTEQYYTYGPWTFIDANGVLYRFGGQTVNDPGGNCPVQDTSTYTATVQGYTLNVTNYDGFTMTYPSGTVWSPYALVDSNGNEITENNFTTYTDTLGATALTISGSGTPSSPKVYAYAGANGNESVTVNYSSENLSGAFNCQGISNYSVSGVPMVTSIGLPDGSSYQFSYDSAGRIAQVTLPTGGVIGYAYSGGAAGTGINCADGSPAKITRTTPDGTWTYVHSISQANGPSTTTVTDPLGDVTTYYFVGNYETERDVNDVKLGLMQTTYNCYNGASAPCNSTSISLPITQRATTTSLPGGQQAKVISLFDSNEMPTEKDSYDWGPTAPGQLLRKVVTTYASLAGIKNRPASVTVYAGDGTTVAAQTNFTYDQQVPTALSGTPQHVAPPTGSRGNVSTVSYWVSGSSAISRSFTYWDTGNVQQATDVNGAVTTYNYSSATSTCGNALPDSITEPLSLSRSFSWNCTGAVLQSRTDENGDKTTLDYGSDPYWRVTSITDPDGGGATISYPDALHTITTTKIDGTRNLVTEVVKDGLGRPIYRQTQNGTNCDTVETIYDADGRPAQVSNPYATTCGSPSAGTQFTITSFDALGRVASVKAVDGSTTTTAYSGDGWQVTDPRGVARVYQSDGLGELTNVCEVSGQSGSAACGLNIAANGFLTTYSRNALGEIKQVNQGAQTRVLNFDGLGRMTSETNPESGTTTYTFDSVTDGTCSGGSSSSAGDLVLTTDAAGGKVCVKYDLLHRMTDRRLSNGNEYTYTWDGSAANHSLGRLASATAPATSDSFIYDPIGRPTSVTENPADLHGTGWTTGYTYNYLGEPTLVASPSGLRTLRYTYDTEGRATALQDNGNSYYFVGSRTFNAASQLTGQQFVPTQNWLQGSIAYNNDGQPWQLDYIAFGGNEVKLQYQWGAAIDASGNVTSNDNDGTLRKLVDATNSNWTLTYGHDDLNRVSSAASADNAINVNESYDRYGNRDNQSGTLNESFAASTATNQINGFTFDSAGRLQAGNFGALGARNFAWDPAGQMTSYSDSTQSLTFKYDPFGRRIEAIPGSGSPYYYFYGASDGGHPVAEYNATGGWRTDFLLDGANVGQIYDSNGGVQMWATDALGSAVEYFEYGVLQISRLYLFGEEGQSTSAEYKWTNQIRDGNALDHFAFRSYSSNLARWLSPDPAGLAAVNPADPQSWDRYAYVENRPLSAADPLGLMCPAPGDSASNCSAQTTNPPLGANWDELGIFTQAMTPTFGVVALDPEFPFSDNSTLYLFFGNEDLLNALPYLDSLSQLGDQVDMFLPREPRSSANQSLKIPQPMPPHSRYDTCRSLYQRETAAAGSTFKKETLVLTLATGIPAEAILAACAATGEIAPCFSGPEEILGGAFMTGEGAFAAEYAKALASANSEYQVCSGP